MMPIKAMGLVVTRGAVYVCVCMILSSCMWSSLGCRLECEVSDWYPWTCTDCWAKNPVHDAAYRDKTICCSNITEPFACLSYCKGLGHNQTVSESGECSTHCLYNQTTTSPTSASTSQHVTGRIPSTHSRWRVTTPSPLAGTSGSMSATTSSIMSVSTAQKQSTKSFKTASIRQTTTSHTSTGTAQRVTGKILSTASKPRTDTTRLPPNKQGPDSQRETGLEPCTRQNEKTAGETTLVYWMVPALTLLVSVLGVQCYIVYRIRRQTSRVQAAAAPVQQRGII